MPKNEQEGREKFVTVVIPVYNDSDALLKCLDGLQRQVYPLDQFEIIIVDNGSDAPLQSIDRYRTQLRIVRCKTPGSYAARNAGVMMAAGNILAFTDADCVPEAEWLCKGVDALLAAGGRNVIGGEVLFLEPEKRSGTALYQQAAGFQQKANIIGKSFTVTANMFCTIGQFRTIGPFNEALFSGGDREWCWRAAQYGFAVLFAPQAVVCTSPRVRLRDAIRQARRVTAGRSQLKDHALLRSGALERYRTLTESIFWVLSISHLSAWERIRVLAAGGMIRLAATLETIKLRFGSAPERS